MACVVAGFPNKVIALQFEWAWQHPGRSRLLRGHADAKALGRRRGLHAKLQTALLLLQTSQFTRYGLRLLAFEPKVHVSLGKLLRGGDGGVRIEARQSLDELPMYLPAEASAANVASVVDAAAAAAANAHVTFPTSDQDLNFCAICFDHLHLGPIPSVACSRCGVRSHLPCLAQATLRHGSAGMHCHSLVGGLDCGGAAAAAVGAAEPSCFRLLPEVGVCPMCDLVQPWRDVIKTIVADATAGEGDSPGGGTAADGADAPAAAGGGGAEGESMEDWNFDWPLGSSNDDDHVTSSVDNDGAANDGEPDAQEDGGDENSSPLAQTMNKTKKKKNGKAPRQNQKNSTPLVVCMEDSDDDDDAFE